MQSLSVCVILFLVVVCTLLVMQNSKCFIVSSLFQLPVRCVCNKVAKILIPPLGSLLSLNLFGSEKESQQMLLFTFACKKQRFSIQFYMQIVWANWRKYTSWLDLFGFNNFQDISIYILFLFLLLSSLLFTLYQVFNFQYHLLQRTPQNQYTLTTFRYKPHCTTRIAGVVSLCISSRLISVEGLNGDLRSWHASISIDFGFVCCCCFFCMQQRCYTSQFKHVFWLAENFHEW